MSQLNYGDSSGMAPPKPKWDIYSTMLMIALVALILGCVCLFYEMQRYGFEFKATV